MKEATPEYVQAVRETFECRDGGLFSIIPRRGIAKGRQFGCISNNGYRIGTFRGVITSEHRLVWLFHNGRWPRAVDHINGVRIDNRIENLRDDAQGNNMQNVGLSVRNTSGIIGVSYSKSRRKWMAQIYADGKSINLGRYLTAEEAAAAYQAAKAVLHQFQPEIVTRKAHPSKPDLQAVAAAALAAEPD